jgi:hypothetical protein
MTRLASSIPGLGLAEVNDELQILEYIEQNAPGGLNGGDRKRREKLERHKAHLLELLHKDRQSLTPKIIAANIEGLRQTLAESLRLAEEASEAMQRGEQNLAIGTLTDISNRLEEARDLFRAALVLHRRSI